MPTFDIGRDSRTVPRSLAVHAAVLAGYVCAAIAYTFPLVLHPATTFPAGNPDVFVFLWNNWWIHHAIVELHRTPFITSMVLAPFPVDLHLHTLALLDGLIALPFMNALGIVGVLNAQVIATAALNGFAGWLLTKDLTGRPVAAFVAGLLLAATPAINFHLVRGRPGCATLWPAIFAIRSFLRMLERPRLRTSAVFAAWLTASMLADQQATLFCVCWLFGLGLWRMLVGRRDLWPSRTLLAMAVAAAIVAWPAYALLWRPLFQIRDYTVPGAIEAYNYSFPVRMLWSPLWVWRLFGTLMPLALVAGLVFVRRMPRAAPWVIGSVLFIVLSLGPVAMGTDTPLLFALFRKLPGLTQFRTPYRFQIPAAIGLAVAVGVLLASALDSTSQRRGRWLVAGAVLVVCADLVLFRVTQGFPLQTMASDAVYDEIARDPRDVVILEVPVGMGFGTDKIGDGEPLTFFQPVHRKRLINGNVSRGPLATLYYYRASPAIMTLANELPPPGDPAADLRQRLRTLSIGYVVLHRDLMEEAWFDRTLALLSGLEELQRIPSGAQTVAFRVAPSVATP